MVSQREQGADGPGGVWGDVVAAFAAGPGNELLAAELGLFRSTPAILPTPVWDGSGSSSRAPSGRNPTPAQSGAVANRSAISPGTVMICAKVLQAPAAAEFLGVVHGGLEAQYVLALGIGAAAARS